MDAAYNQNSSEISIQPWHKKRLIHSPLKIHQSLYINFKELFIVASKREERIENKEKRKQCSQLQILETQPRWLKNVRLLKNWFLVNPSCTKSGPSPFYSESPLYYYSFSRLNALFQISPAFCSSAPLTCSNVRSCGIFLPSPIQLKLSAGSSQTS